MNLGIGFNVFNIDVKIDNPMGYQGRIEYLQRGIYLNSLFTI